VGGFAAQLAVRAGHRVLASATYDDEEWVRGLGVDTVIPRSADLADVGPVPAVLDAVPVGEPAGAAVGDSGVLVSTRPTPPVDPARRVRQDVVLVRPDRAALRELVEAVAKGQLRTRVAATLPLAEAADAHRRFETGGLRGKLVLVS
jgi:NADPH:quinone reductase-like Zn-dependent oxidoreductase